MPRNQTHAGAREGSRADLAAVSGGLRAFLSGSETVFLEAGAQLSTVGRQARSIFDGASVAVTLRERDAAHPVEELDGELARLDAYLRDAHDAMSAKLQGLAALPPEIDLILAAVNGFETIPATLRMLGMNTRIENARGVASGGMETVATEVRRLADLVEPRFQAVQSQATSVLRTATQARAASEAFLARQLASSAELVGELRRALGALRTLADAERAVATRAVQASGHVTRDLDEVLVSLQAHDATRQVVEHVIQELNALEEELGAGEAPDPEAVPARLGEACQILPAQLRAARERLEAALAGIAAHLRAVSAEGAELASLAGRAAGVLAGGAQLEEVARGVARATELLRGQLAHEEEARRALRHVADTVRAMDASVRDIQGIGSAVKIIALNALVETERAGAGGRVLAVLAQGMGALAAEVGSRTREAVRALAQVSQRAEGLCEGTAGPRTEAGERIAASLGRVANALSDHHRSARAEVERLHEGSRALHRDVEEIAARVAEQLEATGALAPLEQTLALRAAAAAPAESPPDAGARAYARYTMEVERLVHDRALGKVDPAPMAPPSATGGELGSNVELF